MAMDLSDRVLGATLRRPASSPDHEVVAVILPDERLSVFHIRTGKRIADAVLPISLRKAFTDLQSIAWSTKPTYSDGDDIKSDNLVRRHLLFTFNHRIHVGTLDLPRAGSPNLAKYLVLMDYKLESHAGKISSAKFVLDNQYILVLFETSTHASIISISGSKRTDIPLPKFSGPQGFAESPVGKAFALMVRAQGQDHVLVLNLSEGILSDPINFISQSSDAQGLIWSPDCEPILAVWDSASYGIKIKFYSALGHPLQQLTINENNQLTNESAQSIAGLGISNVSWVRSSRFETLLAIGDGHGNIFVRAQKNRQMTSALVVQLQHRSTVDGSEYIVWQETENQSFLQQELAIDLQYDQDTPVELLQWNNDSTLLASKIKTFPRALWVWRIPDVIPLTLLIFEHDVKQVAWHPSNPSVLLITTNCKQPIVFCWHDIQLSPQAIHFGHANIAPSSQWRVTWLQPSKGGRALLLYASNKYYSTGLLHRQNDTVVFDDVSMNQISHDIEETELVETPSKPGRNAATSLDTTGLIEHSNVLAQSSENLW